jgi:MEMO1 family protein
VIEALWGGPETLIVVSSDLSHYHPYREAQQLDRSTAQAILALESGLDHEQACGATPIDGLLLCARRRGLTPRLLDLRNSGDTAGDRARVVGYAAFAFYEEEPRDVH